ncbi:SGNH/GDSL hydrolase family protein [[Phormidium] sp. LEGE 05292]|uniref:SGNH/GDSL hydrolase family protein n=1 Tax=[Phormidium] sp. LEGE 05292 TaxID=767427 RepID=UPI001D1573C1|nr:SGNH/GDSL hydrolase family protein [Phormidium sp. LEGE 05292]
MKKWWLATVGFTICLVIILGSFNPLSAEIFPQIYVFGDSLSDVGNVYQATNGDNPPNPPYFKGRYSNGPVWVEYLASRLKLTVNVENDFAYGGAKTGDSQQLPPGVLAQIQRFKAKNSTANTKALYIIWAGANDYLGGATDTTVPINNLATAVKRLAEIGAKNIVLVNLPDLGKLPGTRTTERAKILSSLTQNHNLGLATSVKSLRQQFGDINIRYLDVNALFNQVYNYPGKYGLNNVTQPCYRGGIVCDRPNEFLFWDGIHPSTAGHKLLVQLASPQLKATSKSAANSSNKLVLPLSILIFTVLAIGLIMWNQRNRIGNSY